MNAADRQRAMAVLNRVAQRAEPKDDDIGLLARLVEDTMLEAARAERASPVQPVLSGLEEALDDIDNGAGDESHVRAVVARIRRLAATAPAAKTPPDPFDPDQRYLEDRTAPAADEGPNR